MIRLPLLHATLPILIVGLALLLLAAGLPRDGFVVGDVGVKLIVAREVVSHPLRPLVVNPPTIGDTSAAAFFDPFFHPHGDHAHAATSFAFPLLIAPFVALFGTAGGYVLPMASLLALLSTMIAWARGLESRWSPAIAGWAVALLSPLTFYALECWEHVPAVLCVATASWLGTANSTDRWRSIAAGLIIAMGILLRPEAAWGAVAIALAMMIARKWVCAATFVAASAAGLLPVTLYNALHFGSPWGLHVATNMGPLQDSWLASRAGIVRHWMLTWRTDGSFWATFPLALLAVVKPMWTSRTRALWVLVAIPLFGIVLTAPNDGGSQWGPRYLLVIVPPVLLLALDSAASLLARRDGARWLATALVATIVVMGLATTRRAYRDLRGAKLLHASLAHDVASLRENYVVTDLWWLDQLAAAADPHQTFLYIRDRGQFETVIATLNQEGVKRFVAIRSSESPETIWAEPWPIPFAAIEERHIAVRNLRATTYERRE